MDTQKKRQFSLLLVDDESAVLSALKRVFRKAPYDIHTAENGIKALELLSKISVDAALVDLMMPEMDGFDVLDRMRTNPQTLAVPVVILTSKVLNLDDIKRIERHTRVVVQSKGVLVGTRNAEVVGYILGRLGHRIDAVLFLELPVNEAPAQCRVMEFSVAPKCRRLLAQHERGA